jgi:hypothetical protein
MKFKKYKTYVDVAIDDGNIKMGTCFVILGKPVDKNQALQIAKILCPKENVIDVVITKEEN